jgi:hypothetical protein
MTVKTSPYNPLDKINLGKSVAQALLAQAVVALAETAELQGAGVYAIYYTGPFPAYEPIVTPNRNGESWQPIYVGKAIPKEDGKAASPPTRARERPCETAFDNMPPPSSRPTIWNYKIFTIAV